MKLIYTNYGILTEERLREMKECGYNMDECGMAGEMGGPSMRMGHGYHDMDEEEPVAKVIIIGGEEDMLVEGGVDGPEGSPGFAGNQIANVGPQGTPGSAASGNPGGANIVEEAFNQFAEYLLDTWLHEEKKKKLSKKQKKLDINKNHKLDKFDFLALQNMRKKKAKARKED